jgi:hypothetical protein
VVTIATVGVGVMIIALEMALGILR